MQWSTSRLRFATRFRTQAEISRITGIPQSTLSYATRGERILPAKYHEPLRNLYQRTAYQAMRDVGLSATQARRFSWYGPERVLEVIGEVGGVVDKLVDFRFQQYTDYLKSTGEWISDIDTRTRLREAIQFALSQSDLPEERINVMEYRNTSDL